MRAVLLGGGIALLISLLGTRFAIRQFTRLGYGQPIRDDGPTTHHTKRGTPTMGGGVIVLASVRGLLRGQAHHLDRAVRVRAAPDLPVRRTRVRRASSTTSSRSPGRTASACGARPSSSARASWRWSSGRSRCRPGSRTTTAARPASLKVSFLREIEWLSLPMVLAVLLILVIVTGHQQRGEPRRRARRPGHGRVRDGLRCLHAGQHLAEQPVLPGGPRTALLQRPRSRSTSRSSRRPSPGPASASSGGTPRPRPSSWATPGRSRWAGRWPASRS